MIDDLVPQENRSLSIASNFPLTNHNIRIALPETILRIFNKLYSNRYELSKQSNQLKSNKESFEKKLAKFDAKLNLLKRTNEEQW